MGLFLLRTLTLFLITILLISPFINLNINKSLKPKVVLLVDNSESISSYDGITLKKYRETIQEIEEQISDYFEVETHYFSDKLDAKDSFLLQGNRTDLYNALQSSDEIHFNENIQSVVLISDGNYNLGNNFNYYNFTNPVECHSLLVGDTSRFFDIEIGNIDFNPLAYLNEKSNINIQLNSEQVLNKKINLSLYEIKTNGANNLIQSKDIVPNVMSYTENHSFSVKMNQEGIHHYRMIAKCLSGEKNCDNNYKDFFIEVVNGKKKVVVFADAPHPDISAMKSALEKNEAFDVRVQILLENTSEIGDIDLAILYQIPSQFSNRVEFIKKLNEKSISILYFLGSGSNYSVFNQLQSLYQVTPQGNLKQDIAPQFNKEFSSFKLTENTQANYLKFPPMQSNYLNITTVKQSEVFMFQKIGNVTTNKPLISMGFMDNQSIGFVFAENIWKWKMMDYKNFKSFDHFDEIIVKMINYLAIKKDKKKFKVHFDKTFFTEKEDINIDAAVYNASYELTNVSDVSIEILGNNKYKSKGLFLKNGDKYSLNIGSLPPGNYQYTASTSLNGVNMIDKGNFAVTSFQLEKAYKRANFEDMNKFAQNHNGTLQLFENWKQLLAVLKKKESKELLISESKTITFIDSWIYMSTILFLLSLEWLLRKYFGKN